MGSEHVRPRASLPREVQKHAPLDLLFCGEIQQFW